MTSTATGGTFLKPPLGGSGELLQEGVRAGTPTTD